MQAFVCLLDQLKLVLRLTDLFLRWVIQPSFTIYGFQQLELLFMIKSMMFNLIMIHSKALTSQTEEVSYDYLGLPRTCSHCCILPKISICTFLFRFIFPSQFYENINIICLLSQRILFEIDHPSPPISFPLNTQKIFTGLISFNCSLSYLSVN